LPQHHVKFQMLWHSTWSRARAYRLSIEGGAARSDVTRDDVTAAIGFKESVKNLL